MFTGFLPFLFVLIFPFNRSASYPYLSTTWSVKGMPLWMGRIFFVAFTADQLLFVRILMLLIEIWSISHPHVNSAIAKTAWHFILETGRRITEVWVSTLCTLFHACSGSDEGFRRVFPCMSNTWSVLCAASYILGPTDLHLKHVRPPSLYAINPYCRGMLCSHYTMGVSKDYCVTVVIVLGSGDPPVPTPHISSFVLLPQSFTNICSLSLKIKPNPVRGEGFQSTLLH